MDKEQRDPDRQDAGEQADDAPIIEHSYEALLEELEKARRQIEAEDLVDTAHTDGSTDNPTLAQQQGLVYRPPSDPPVLPADDPQGAKVAAGFAGSMEEADLSAVDLPARVAGNDLDMEQRIRTLLANSSETANLSEVRLSVRDGIVFLAGSVNSREDIAIVDEMLRDLPDIVDVRNRLDVASSRAG